jgi:hypothetical protein
MVHPGFGLFFAPFFALVLYSGRKERSRINLKTRVFSLGILSVVDHAHEADADDADAHSFHEFLTRLDLWVFQQFRESGLNA